MTFFKVIKDENIVDVGCTFLKWNTLRHKLYICNADDAQLVQSYDEAHIYHAAWLKPLPVEAGEYELAIVQIIDETEFNDLLEQLGEGEIPVVEEVEEEPIHIEPQEEEKEEKPISISEMRKIIVEQQKQIELLMQKISE